MPFAVAGAIFGQQDGRQIEIFNSFGFVLTSAAAIDMNYLTERIESCKTFSFTSHLL
jgi:hypothetical protein